MVEVTDEMIKNGMIKCHCGEELYFKKDAIYTNDEIARCECGEIWVWRSGCPVPIIELK